MPLLLSALALGPGTLAISGCGDGPAVRFRVHRPSWDTLVVTVAGSWTRAAPEALTVSVVDARGFVVAEGRASGRTDGSSGAGAWRLPIPDAALGSRAPLIVEVCAREGGDAAAWACEQAPFAASPKRSRSQIAATYPVEGDPDRLLLRARVSSERPAQVNDMTGASGWRPAASSARMLVRLSVEGRADEAVVVPLPVDASAADTLRLAGQAGYDAYWLGLQQRLFYGESARVRVEVLRAGAGADEPPVADFVRTVAAATEADRRAAVLRLAVLSEAALGRALPALDDSTVTSTVSGWRFDRLRRRYQIRMALAARDTLGRAQTWRGDLWAPEGPGTARFAESPTGDTLRRPIGFSFFASLRR